MVIAFKEQGGKKEYLISLAIFLVVGILATHLLRVCNKKTNWLKYSFDRIAILFLLGVGATGIALFYGDNFIEFRSGYSYDKYVFNKRLDKAKKMEEQNGLSSKTYYTDA